ncbi:MAG: glycoside hydrolase family 15 protein [Acidobacteria bacterium]|nr:glycoside hydrolase family 15 protein [Acidobacteriota bacterium]
MRIEDYALIGDCQTAALVSRDGSIDWLCWPNFDSEACFARLLGDCDNGFWKLAPDGAQPKTTRRYDGDTLILQTTHKTRTGEVLVTDFMPTKREHSQIIRIVQGIHGKVRMCSELSLRFSYGNVIPWVTHTKYGIRAVAGPDAAELRSDIPLSGENMRTLARFTIHKGESVTFSLICGTHGDYQEHLIKEHLNPQRALKSTRDFWCGWAKRSNYHGPYRDLVMRSLLVLKALTFAPTGGIVAAPTTSLPEWIGGTRNWDYRFCWLRDTTFTLLALSNAGYREEARAWMDWLRRTIAGNPENIQIMYGISGERMLLERELCHLKGFENSLPVRIGNGAATQRQLDIFGEVLDSFYWAFRDIKHDGEAEFAMLRHLMHRLEGVWNKPDAGMWEVRGDYQHFTFSKMMTWLAFDRAVRIATEHKLRAPIAKWAALRDRIHRQICRRGFNKKLNAFTQAYGSTTMDASVLLLVLAGFLPPDDPRILGTVAAVEKKLLRDGFVLRYETARTDDGVGGEEGQFLACSFWYVRCLRMIGREADAMEMFDRLCRLPNDVGLLSEEYDPKADRMLGNFPQAFSHISLINTAHQLMNPEKTQRFQATMTQEASGKIRTKQNSKHELRPQKPTSAQKKKAKKIGAKKTSGKPKTKRSTRPASSSQ